MLSDGSPLCPPEILSHGFQAARPFLQNEHIVLFCFFLLVFNWKKKRLPQTHSWTAQTALIVTEPVGHSCQMEVAAPKGRAGLGFAQGCSRSWTDLCPPTSPNSFQGQGYAVALTDPARLICLSRCRSLKGIAAVEINVAPWAACLFLTRVPLGQFCVCACTHACVWFVLLFCFFSLWVRVNPPVYPGLKVTHSHFGTPRASAVQLRSQTDLRTSSKKVPTQPLCVLLGVRLCV